MFFLSLKISTGLAPFEGSQVLESLSRATASQLSNAGQSD